MWLAACAAVVVLGTVQALSSVALRSSAQTGAWPVGVPGAIVRAVDTLDPALPLPPALRLVFARAALAAHDLPRAAAEAARLGASRDRYALDGGIAQARGATGAAVTWYLAAGDLSGLETRVDQLASEKRFAQALALQHETIARLRNDRIGLDALAQASFWLGRLEERQAWEFAVGTPERHRHEVRSRDAYADAVKLAPLSQQYLLAYGNQQLNLRQFAAAEKTFERARDVDPTSAEPLLGLGDAAARRGDMQSARAFLARARAVDATSEAARRLAREIGR